nr:hypothetical protein [Xylanibacter rodentium]
MDHCGVCAIVGGDVAAHTHFCLTAAREGVGAAVHAHLRNGNGKLAPRVGGKGHAGRAVGVFGYDDGFAGRACVLEIGATCQCVTLVTAGDIGYGRLFLILAARCRAERHDCNC